MESAAGGEAREAVRDLSRLWWLWLVAGIFWTIIAVVILQFDQASINTVGVIIGIMFFAAGAAAFVSSGLVERRQWLFGIFGVLFLGAGGDRAHQPREHLRGDRRHPRLPLPARRRLLDHPGVRRRARSTSSGGSA